MTLDERISAELRRHAPEVDEHVAWERIRSAAPARGHARMIRLVAIPVAALAGFLLLGFILVPNFSSDLAPASDPQSPFVGTWVSIDGDGSTQTMVIEASGDETVEIAVHDNFASVCSGAPSTMTGTGRLDGTTMLIPSPVLTCDDGSEPEALSGPPLEEQLRNFNFVFDAETDTLTDKFRLYWNREGADDPSPGTMSILWPQSSLEEVREAQELADAGDPRYTWQVEPELAAGETAGGEEIFARFLEEKLGWEEFMWNPFGGNNEVGQGTVRGVEFIRCAPAETNLLYPNAPLAGECAPTIDEFRYETVQIDIAQLAGRGPTGIWVVTQWRSLAPFQQMTPPSDAELTALLKPFLQTRIDGEGAEEYLDEQVQVPLLYGTTTGAPYERFEFERVYGPEWPDGGTEFKVRLFAEGGKTVVEQLFRIDRDAPGPLDFEYSPDGGSTTENGLPAGELPQPHQFLDGEVTFSAAPAWDYSFAGWDFTPTMDTLLLDNEYDERVVLVADPLPIGTGCEKGPAPADAEALAQSIRTDPDLEMSEPVAVSVGGIEGVRIDVVAARGASGCDEAGRPEVLAATDPNEGSHRTVEMPVGHRMRLYLLDLPEELSAGILAIAIVAPEQRFDHLVAAAASIVDSFEFRTE